MVVGVVAYDVSLRRHPADDVRGRFDHVAHHEEGRRSTMLFQRIQNGLGVAVFVAAVKSKIDDFFICLLCIVGVILLKLIERCITDRNFAFLLKAETPVFGSRQNRGEGIAGSRGCRNCAGGSCITG